MNLTISVDAELVEKAREIAKSQGTSLQALLRRYLESLAGETPPDETADELLRLMNEFGGHSGGVPFRREDAYEDRL